MAMTLSPKNDNSNPQQGPELRTALSPPNENTTQDALQKMDTSSLDDESSRANANANAGTSSPAIKKLFVGGLPQDVTQAEFEEFFGQFGVIVDSVVMFDRVTQRSRGFGFVTYGEAEVANRLLQMSVEGSDVSDGPLVGRLNMRGKTCEVKAAEPKESARNNRGSGRGNVNGAARRFPSQKNGLPGGRHDYYQYEQHPGAAIPHQVYSQPEPHYAGPAAGYGYPMYAPGYYPAYYPGAGGAHVLANNVSAPMYAPMHQAVPFLEPQQQFYGSSMTAPIHANQPVYMMDQNGHHPAVAYVADHSHNMMYPPAYPQVFAPPADVTNGIVPAPVERQLP